MLLENFISNNSNNIQNEINFIKIPIKKLKLKLLKRRVLEYKETQKYIKYNFFIKKKGFSYINNNIVYVPNIVLNKFLLNITPIGFKKTTKEVILGIEQLNKRKKELLYEKEKDRNKKEPGKGIEVDGPGR